jgi:type II pantothenate kinase
VGTEHRSRYCATTGISLEKTKGGYGMSVVIGIDIGGSSTKIVGFSKKGKKWELIEPQVIKANDPITATYGAFGKFTDENNLSISDISKVMMTGVGASHVKHNLYGLKCQRVAEFDSIGRGGTYLSGLSEALVVSMGTGTAMVHAMADGSMKYLGGTGVGGGTLLGLSRRMIGVDTIEHLEQLCEGGDLGNVDLRIKDMSSDHTFQINDEITASNFGKLSDIASQNDVALGIANMVGETIATLAVFAARRFNLKNVVLTGNLTAIKAIAQVFEDLEPLFDVKFIIPERSQFATVIGAALCDKEEK